MEVKFIQDLPVGIKKGEVKDLPFHRAQFHINEGHAKLNNKKEKEFDK